MNSPIRWLLPNLLDRYIFRQLIDFFILGVVVFSLVAFFSDTLFDFINDVQKYGISPMTLLTIVGLQLPRSVSFVIPASCFLAVLMVYNSLNSNFELVAVRMNGVSLNRMIRPAVVLGLFSTICTYVINDYIVPFCNYQTEQLKQAAIANASLPANQKSFMFKAYDRNHNLTQMIYVGNFQGRQLGDSTIIDLTHRKESVLKTMKIVQAKSGTYDPNAGWEFGQNNTYIVATNANNSTSMHSESFRVKKLISNKEDLEEQREREKNRAEGILTDAATQNFFQLLQVIQRREAIFQKTGLKEDKPSRKSYLALWEKISMPLSSVVIILSAVALAVHNPRQGSQKGFLLGLFILFLYYVIRMLCVNMGRTDFFEINGLLSRELGLFIAAWMPLLLMGVLGYFLLDRRSKTL